MPTANGPLLIPNCRLPPVTFHHTLPVLARALSLSYDDPVRRRGPLRPGGIPVGEFGDKFRKEREKKGISLEDVSNATKISCRMLRAIEEEHFDQLPGGVFNKGFIRAYAKHLGLNDDEAVAGYLACLRQEQLDAQATWDLQTPTGAPEKRGQGTVRRQGAKPLPPEAEELPELQLPRAEHVGRPPSDYPEQRDSIPWRLLALALLVIVLAAVLWHRHLHSARFQTASTAPPATSAVQPTPPPAVASAPLTTAAPSRSRPSAAAAPASVRPLPPGAPSPARAQSAIQPPAAAPANAAASEITTKSVELLNPQLPPRPPAPLTLVIRAAENSWISVSADGQAVFHETLIAPAHVSVHAAREIVLKIGNAAGVTFLWNGQEIPAQGAEAEVKTLVFDDNGMREVPPSQAPVQNR